MLFKIDNVNNLTSARWAAAEGFDVISFNFDKSHSHYIKPMNAAEICPWISGLKFSGNFSNTEPSVIVDIFNLLKLDAIEIELDSVGEWLIDAEIPSIIKVNESNIQKAIEFENNFNFIVAFSIDSQIYVPENLPIERCFFPSQISKEKLIKTPFGLCFNSANETEVGVVDFEELEIITQKWQNI